MFLMTSDNPTILIQVDNPTILIQVEELDLKVMFVVES